jgi:hypothetical protein
VQILTTTTTATATTPTTTTTTTTTTVARSILNIDAPLEIGISIYGTVITGYIFIGLFVLLTRGTSRYALGLVGVILGLIGLGYIIALIVLFCAIKVLTRAKKTEKYA